MQGVLSQYSTIGTLLIVLASMNMISNERQNHAAVLVMMRPVSIIQYIMSKWAAQIVLIVASARPVFSCVFVSSDPWPE